MVGEADEGWNISKTLNDMAARLGTKTANRKPMANLMTMADRLCYWASGAFYWCPKRRFGPLQRLPNGWTKPKLGSELNSHEMVWT